MTSRICVTIWRFLNDCCHYSCDLFRESTGCTLLGVEGLRCKKVVARHELTQDQNFLSTDKRLMLRSTELARKLLQLYVIPCNTCKTYPDRISCWDTDKEGTLSLASWRICIVSGLRDLQSQHHTLASYEPDINTVLSG